MASDGDISNSLSSSQSSNSILKVVSSVRCKSFIQTRSNMPITSPPSPDAIASTSKASPRNHSIAPSAYCNIPEHHEYDRKRTPTTSQPMSANVKSIIFSSSENVLKTKDVRMRYQQEQPDFNRIEEVPSANSPDSGCTCCFLELWSCFKQGMEEWCCFPDGTEADNNGQQNAGMYVGKEACCCCPGSDSQENINGNGTLPGEDDIWNLSKQEVKELSQVGHFLDLHPAYVHQYILEKVPVEVLKKLYNWKMHPRGLDNEVQETSFSGKDGTTLYMEMLAKRKTQGRAARMKISY